MVLGRPFLDERRLGNAIPIRALGVQKMRAQVGTLNRPGTAPRRTSPTRINRYRPEGAPGVGILKQLKQRQYRARNIANFHP